MSDTFARMRQLIGTTAQWTSCNIVLGFGEIGLELMDSGVIKMKVGDGVTTFSGLPYLTGDGGGKWENAALQTGYDGYDDCMLHEDYVAWQRACLSEMMRVLRDDGAIFYNHKWRVQNGLLQDRQEIVDGFPVRQIIIWHRAGGINFNPGYFLPNYEVIYLIAKSRFRLAPKANTMGCIWRINQEHDNPHPAPFPVKLARRCIEAVGAGPILDPFIGSGTTAIAADALGFDWIGIDRSADYIAMAKDRILNSYHSI